MAFLARRKITWPGREIMTLSQVLPSVLASPLEGMLWLERSYRLSAERALRHPWFNDGC